MPKDHIYYAGLGRRKESTATARLTRGKGTIQINNKPAQDYFGHQSMLDQVKQPLVVIGKVESFDVSLRARGGGKRGQAEASRLAVANALVTMDKELRTTLKKAGLIKRDSRVKERKKYGLKRARKAPQYTKR